MRLVVLCAATFIFAACGPEETADGSSVSAGEPSLSKVSAKSGKSPLTNTPISFADATGETSKMIEVGPCPFLSDETIIASVRSNFEITRREVSNSLCRWAYNAGFKIEVTLEDSSSARPISKRRYNIGVDTVLDPQDGPGDNAMILNDTAWDKPRPFAYSFEKDGKLVFMNYTGFHIKTDMMRQAANEVASRMSSAPSIEAQRRHTTEPFKVCEVWSGADLKSVFNVADTAVVSQGMKGKSTCNWKIYEDGISGQKTAGFNIYKPEPAKKAAYEYDGFKPFDANGETHYLRKTDSDFGMYINIITPRPEGLVTVTVSDPNKDATAEAKVFQENLLNRMVP